MRSVSIKGVDYVSASEAARALGLAIPTLMTRVLSRSPEFTDWYFSDGLPTPKYKYPPKRLPFIWVYYFLTHVPTKLCYVGATGRYEKRKKIHLTLLADRRHHCKKLQETFNGDPDPAHWRWEAFIVGSREEAFRMEQKFIEMLHSENRLLNTSLDGRAPVTINNSDPLLQARRKEALDKWRSANRAQMSAVASAVCEKRWSDPTAKERWMGSGNPFAKKVKINGHVFGSVNEASRELGIPVKRIRRLARDPDNKDFHFT